MGLEQRQSDLDTKNSTFPRQGAVHPDQENTQFDLNLSQKSRQSNRRAETDMHFEMNLGFYKLYLILHLSAEME